MRKIHALPLAALSALTLALGAAHATSLPYKSFDKLVGESDGIVVATVRNVQMATDGQRDIDTFVTFDNLKVIEGRYAAPTITLRLKGGRVGNEILFVDGVPQFKADERVVLFMQGNGRDLVPLVGWTQGLFRLLPDAASGETIVADSAGRPVLGVKANHVLTLEGDGATAEEAHVLGAPNADYVMHAAAAGQASAGKTDDGSTTALDTARLSQNAKPMTESAFVSMVQDRSAARAAELARSGVSLKSVEMGGMTPAVEHRDAVSADARANAAAFTPAPEAAQPALPRHVAAHALDSLQ